MIELKVKELKSFRDKLKGLLGEKKATPVLIKTRFGIHTFFLKFPIDVLILDDQNYIIDLCQNLKPFRLFFWNPIYYKVVELPSGEITKKNLKKGDKIKLGSH